MIEIICHYLYYALPRLCAVLGAVVGVVAVFHLITWAARRDSGKDEETTK